MKINIKNLSNELYIFKFNTKRKSINFEQDDRFINEIQITSIVERRDKDIFVKNHVRTIAKFVCDNCLVDFSRILEDEYTIIYTWDPEAFDFEDENFVLLYAHTREIDLKHGVRDSLLLATPMKVVCSAECKGLCPTCGVNLNEETCQCVRKRMDPRWQALKRLIA